jgi:signal peptide peptidase SppA
MNRETFLALLGSAHSVPWALDLGMMQSAERTAMAMLRGGQFPKAAESPEGAAALGEPLAAVHPLTERATARKSGAVAVIPVRGVISNRISFFDLMFGAGITSPGGIVRAAQQAVADDGIKSVIFDYDTPGGVTTGIPEAFDVLSSLRGKKPMIAQVSGQCCSGGFWLANAQDEIVASPSAVVGSLGCYMTHEDWSKLYAEIGIERTYIQEGQYKTEGSDNIPLSDEARAHLQEMVGDFMAMFVDAVAKGRGVTAGAARGEQFGQGRAYVAERARSRGMVDKVRTLTDTLQTYGVDPNQGIPETGKGRRSLALLNREVDTLA